MNTIHQKSVCIIASLLLSLSISISLASAQTVSISPVSRTVSLWSGDTVDFNVYITGVTDLAGFEFDLTYDPNILNVDSPSKITEGSFLSKSGSDPTDWTSPKLSSGFVSNGVCVRLKGSGQTYLSGVSGSGILATVQFDILRDKSPGRSDITLSDIKLSDRNVQPITFTTSAGYVDTKECTGAETRPCSSSGCAGTRTCSNDEWGTCNASCPGEICDGIDNDQDGYIDNAQGQGDYTLNRPCSDNHLGICAVGTETCTSSGWAGCPQATTEICNNLDEDCDGDNTECLADIDGNGCVNVLDLAFVSSRFGLRVGNSGWDNRADLVANNEVDIFDLVTVARDYLNGPNC
jgi:hypothetical protein